ncbi:MAG: hypothetical protein CMH52_03240 [Myxococcales bacterium]|nr:hypothetical protein [Myxococcales bacterium]
MSESPQNKQLTICWKSVLLVACLTVFGCGECEEDYDCPGMLVCNPSSNQCEAFVCRNNRDCEVGYTCSENRCEQSPETRQSGNADELELQRR